MRAARAVAVARAIVLASAAAAVLLLGTSGIAQAHAALISTDPADGATLVDEPTEVELEFNDTIGSPAYVVVTAPDGSRSENGEPEVVNNIVTQKTEPSGIAGDYQLSYRVVSADGHPVEGTITYTVQNGRSVTTAQDDPAETTDDGSFVHRHQTHLLWGAGGIVAAAILLLWPQRKHHE